MRFARTFVVLVAAVLAIFPFSTLTLRAAACLDRLRRGSVRLTAAVLSGVVLFALFTGVGAQQQAEKLDLKAGSDTQTRKNPINGDLFPYAAKDGDDDDVIIPTADLITAGTYGFSVQGGIALEDMSSGTTQLVAASSDDNNSALVNIGFDFWFDGVRFTQFGVNGNGFARLGLAPTGTSFTNSIGTTTNAPKIMPFWDDLCVGTNGKVHYKTVGSAPDRKLVIEFQNMQITRGAGCAGVGNGTFQLWLFESAAATNSGVIQFVYGALPATAAGDGGYSVGLQSGAATNFASVTTTTDSVSYAAANNAQTTAIAAGKSYLFSPVVPAAPTGLNFTAVTATSQTVGWTDNASNEIGYAIYRSTDGTNFTFVTQSAAGSTSFNDTLLTPNTTYFYRVYAASEGALSTVLAGSNATATPGNITSAASGNWSDTATWTGGVIPTASDNVTIQTGHTVTIDTAAAAFSVTVQNAVLQFEDTTARTLTVGGNVTVSSGSTFQSGVGGTQTGHVLSVGGNITNNGTLDFSTNANTAGAGITFSTGASNVTFGGGGVVTDVRAITVAKGAQATVVELNPINFSVQGVNTDVAGFLTLTSGTFKISGNFTLTNRTFTSATYTIPALGGIWLNNPNYTVAGQAGGTTTANNGLFRMSQGVYNIGVGAADGMGGGAGASFVIEGGTINATRIDPQTAVVWNMSGGTINISPTVGNSRSNFGSFELFSTASSFTMSGGTINLIQASVGATPVDWNVLSNPISITGGTLNVGTAATATNFNFRIRGNTPNLVVDNTTNNKTATFTAQTLIRGTTTINPGTTFALNGFLVAPTSLSQSANVTNNGTITGNTAGSRLYFLNSGGPAISYSGSGVAGTGAAPLLSVDFDGGATTTSIGGAASNLITARVILFSGNVTGANKLECGVGGASICTTQVGNTTTPTAAGTFDAPFTFNVGTGGQITSYLRTTTPYTTGGEINPSRTLTSMTVDTNTSNAVVGGGPLTVTGALTLTTGFITTSNANLLTHNGTATRGGTCTVANCYVNGPLARNVAVAAYTFHVGKNGYSPVLVNTTALGAPTTFTAEAVDSFLTGFLPGQSLSRYWNLTESGDITADLSFTYNTDAADVNGNEADYRVFKRDGAGVVTNQCSGGPCVNAGTNTIGPVVGVTDFSAWTGAEAAGTDTNAPDTQILTNPPDPSSSTDATFTFSGTDSAIATVASFECKLDADAFAACTSPQNYTSLSTGSHTFQVRAIDTAANVDPTPASYTWTINTGPTGPVTVTATAGIPGPTNYPTLKDAIDAINAGTHQGDITVVIVTNTTETATSVLNGSGAGTAAYTSVVIRPAADGVTVAGPSAQGRGLIELNGADSVTIDGDNPGTAGTNRNLTLQNTATNTTTFTSVVRLALATTVITSTDNVTIKNLNILGSSTGRNIPAATSTTASENTTFGIFAGPGASTVSNTTAPSPVISVSTSVAAGATATNLLVNNNAIVTAARAVSMNGAATSVFPGLQITGNTIGNQTAGAVDQVTSIGITAQGSANGVISGNTVWVEGYVRSSAATHAINVGVNSANGTFTIDSNRVNRARNNDGQTWSAYGINLGGGSSHVVQNNFISGMMNDQTAGTGGFGTTFGAYGIRIASGTGHKVYHNSVHLYGALAGVTSTDLSAAFLMTATSQTGVDVRNNIFSNQITGGNPTGTRHVAVFLPSGATSAMNLTWNNNAYFGGTDALSRLAQVGATFGTGEYLVGNFDPTATTPATNFRAYTSTLSGAGTNDNASFATQAAPPFTSNVNLHVPAATATRLESGGVAVGVTADIDTDARNATTPDIGADEFAGLPPFAHDIQASTLVTPANGTIVLIGQSFTPQATFTNNGTATETSVTVRYKIIDPSTATIYNQTAVIPTIAPLQNVLVTFPSTSLSTAGVHTIQASSELAGDLDPNNDTKEGSVTAVPPLGTTIDVGSGQTYTSLTNPGGLFQALNNSGISGNTTVNITSDLTGETGAVALNQITEVGVGGYTLTIKPSGGPRTITGTGSGLSTIKLNGADRVTIDGSSSGGTDRSLTVVNPNASTGAGVIWIGSASASNGATNNTVKNVITRGASPSTTLIGIVSSSGATLGGVAETQNNNNTYLNNLTQSTQYGIATVGPTGNETGNVIAQNDVGSAVAGDKIGFNGVAVFQQAGATVSDNRISGVLSTGAGVASGIRVAGTANGISINGNRISDVKNTLASGGGSNGIQLNSTVTTANVTVSNNFIWDVASQGTSGVLVTSNGWGIIAVTGGAYNIYFNSINLNTDQTAAASITAAVNITSGVTTAGTINLRNNVLSNVQTIGTRYAVYSAAPASVFAGINYNDYFAQNVGNIGGIARVTLADWQTGTGQDANSVAVDPLFMSSSNLHLQSGSPVRNLAVAGTGIITDIDGDPRDGTPDIGADETTFVGVPGSLQFSSATYSAGEAAGSVTITVTRTGGSDGTVGVNYATSNGTATGGASCTPGVDYVNNSGTLTFGNGVTSQTFNVTICNDATDEPDETINYALSNPTGGATIGMPSTAIQTIVDDDAPGTISVNDVRVTEGNGGTVNATFTLTYTGFDAANTSVQYATANGTATAGIDYFTASGTVSFGGPITEIGGVPTTTRTVSVAVIGGLSREANETFFLNLSNAANATITDGQGVGIIIDDDRSYVADFDADRHADYSVFRPGENRWYVHRSTDGVPDVFDMGAAGDIPVPGDYDVDGKADYAVWRPSTGQWIVRLSGAQIIETTVWGTNGDKPVQGDYDGDGRTDLAIFRPSTGTWWIRRSSDGTTLTQAFGLATDKLVQGDYDGDFKTDIAVYRGGTWYILQSSNGSVRIQNWGTASDRPVSGDFDGDGSNDLAIYRDGQWWILNSLTGTSSVLAWGLATDIPSPADFDADGTTDVVVFRPSTGDWYLLRSSNATITGEHWGQSGDAPTPAAYLPQ